MTDNDQICNLADSCDLDISNVDEVCHRYLHSLQHTVGLNNLEGFIHGGASASVAKME